MKSFIKKAILAVFCALHVGAQACTIYFTNDTLEPVLLVTADGCQSLPVAKGKMKVLEGNNGHRAYFHVLAKQKGKQDYVGVCTLRQYACSASKTINIAMSDVVRFKVDTNIFKIEKAGRQVVLE